jgi:hypothetical protein
LGTWHAGTRPASPGAKDDDPDTALLAAFDVHLGDPRGLQRRSREEILRLTRRMLGRYHDQDPTRPLDVLCGKDILAFVSRALSGCVADGTQFATVSLRNPRRRRRRPPLAPRTILVTARRA